MKFRKFLPYLAIIIFLVEQVYSQTEVSVAAKTDTVGLQKENLVRLSLNTALKSNPFYFDFEDFQLYNQTFILENLSKYYFTKQQNVPLEMLPSLQASNNSLNFALKEQYKFRTAGKLGVFGEILYYVNFAAVGYLLYEHLRTFKDEYKEDFGKGYKSKKK